MSASLQIVAVANEYPRHDYLVRGYEAFLKSSRRYGFEPVILGWGRPWTGLGSKPKLLKQAIENGTVNAENIIFADAYDVWFATNPANILRKKQGFFPDSRIVWNAEKSCFPDNSLAQHHPITDSPFKYLNSGLSVGDTAAYLECLTEMEVDKWVPDYRQSSGIWVHRNDQDDWMRRFLFGQCPGQIKMALDHQCELFQTLTGVVSGELRFDHGEVEDERIYNLTTDTWPMAYHANGPAKTAGLMEPILQHLQL